MNCTMKSVLDDHRIVSCIVYRMQILVDKMLCYYCSKSAQMETARRTGFAELLCELCAIETLRLRCKTHIAVIAKCVTYSRIVLVNPV